MFKKTAYLTAIVALIGTGLVNAFPAVAQDSTLDTSTTTTLSPDEGPNSQWADMMNDGEMGLYMTDVMGDDFSTMMNDGQIGLMADMMNDGEMGLYMTDVMGDDYSTMVDGHHSTMMSGYFNNNSTGDGR